MSKKKVTPPEEKNGLIRGGLEDEIWREYEWLLADNKVRVYRIENPAWVFFRKGGTTHRVVDSRGVVHCVPAPGYFGCVLRWQNDNAAVPVNW